jgi:succinoglycan biosynthesis transport protein ExoP
LPNILPYEESLPGSPWIAGDFSGEQTGTDWRSRLQVLRKRCRLILGFAAATVLATAVAVLFVIAPLYTASTTLLIDRALPQVLDVPESVIAPGQFPDTEHDYYKTQSEILQSRDLAATVIEGQKLEHDPYFVKAMQPLVPRWITRQLDALLRLIGAQQPSPAGQSAVDPRLVDFYLDHVMKVEPILQTELIQLQISTPSSELSARLANAHAAAFVNGIRRLRNTATAEGQSFLEERLEELRGRLRRSESALNEYTRAHGLLDFEQKEEEPEDSKNNLMMEKLSDLQKFLTQAEADRIGTEAQLLQVRKGNYEALPGVMDDELVQDLKNQLATLRATEAGLATQYTDDYPRLATIHAQVESVENELSLHLEKYVASLKATHAAALIKEHSLRASYAAEKVDALALKDAALEYAILSREVNTDRELYKTLLERMKQMGMASQLPTSGVSIVDVATAPIQPSRPKKLLSLLVAAFAGLVVGSALAFTFESLDTALKTPEEVEAYLRLPTLSLIPDLTKLLPSPAGKTALVRESKRLRFSPQSNRAVVHHHDTVFMTPSGSAVDTNRHLVVEAFHSLCTSITLSKAGQPPQILLFTSTAAGEGKTLIAVETAVSFARLGARVLLIDADLRQSSCHHRLGMENGKGLSDVLTGQADLGEGVRSTGVPNLSFLSSGSPAPNPVALVGSASMRAMLASLRGEFEYIVVDTCPSFHLSEPILLSTLVDGVLLVLNASNTPRDQARTTIVRLQRHRANLLGVVMNRMELNHPRYVYG